MVGRALVAVFCVGEPGGEFKLQVATSGVGGTDEVESEEDDWFMLGVILGAPELLAGVRCVLKDARRRGSSNIENRRFTTGSCSCSWTDASSS